MAARRHAAGVVRGNAGVRKLFGELAERYADRQGGYTRVIRTQKRKNDAAQMAFIEYVDRQGELRPARNGANPFLPPAAKAAALED